MEWKMYVPVEKCQWCNGVNTEWTLDHEPDIDDLPDMNIEDETVCVNLCRYCKDCEQNYIVRMQYNIRAGQRVQW